MSDKGTANKQNFWRLYFVFMLIIALFATGLWRVWNLQVADNSQLQSQGNMRTVRNEVISAHRGNILDRNGEPLAISTPVLSLWMHPGEVLADPGQWPALAVELSASGIDPATIKNRLDANATKEFIWVQRRMSPEEAGKILEHDFDGVYAREEYRRFYPLGEVAAHVVGLSNEDEGQEGLEFSYNDWLQGEEGSRRVLKDRTGRIISEEGINKVAQPGKELQLSIDSRIQYLAYRALKEAVTKRSAQSGTAVVVDVKTGEVLALVNQPSYNPNNRASIVGSNTRNRAIVDSLEPGSTVKPFTITAALESGLFDLESVIDTSPGYVVVDGSTKKDPVNYGQVTLKRIITKSSQVGAIKLGLAIGEEPMLDVLKRVGFGQVPGTSFPSESLGMLPNHSRWSRADIASLAYGYGFKVSTLQLAQAYTVFANQGLLRPLTLLRDGNKDIPAEQVIAPELVSELVAMMETVVSSELGGTGVRAALPAYRVAGKTGTAWIYDVARGGYDENNYTSLFAGFLPVSDPEVVIVITVHQPQGDEYGGGQVAAPVFAEIAEGAMRLLNVAPDNLQQELSMNIAPQAADGAQ